MMLNVQTKGFTNRAAGASEAGGAVIEHAIKVVIDALGERGIRSDRLVLVGGGSLTERSALAVGADVYCPNAAAALVTAKALRAKRSEPAN